MAQPAFDDDVSQARREAAAMAAAAAGALATNLVQHILLVTDGTVTNVLEAYAGEPISVIKLRQSIEPAGGSVTDLEVRASAEVMRREVLLRGRDSGRTFVYALSHIVPDRLEPALRRGLLESSKPIGRLIEENGVETFREILTSRCEPARARGSHFGIDPDAAMLSRTYRILAHGWPIMLITEKFPADAFSA